MTGLDRELDGLLARALAEDHPADAARVVEGFAPELAAALFEEWGPGPTASVLERMAADAAAVCLARMPASAARETLARLDLDSAAIVLRRATPEVRDGLLAAADWRIGAPLARLVAAAEGTAGGLLDPLVLALPGDLEVAAALERVKSAPLRALAYLYVLDRRGVLIGVVTVRELLAKPPDARLEAVTRSPVMRLRVDDDHAAIVAHPGWNEFHALPVVDEAGCFLGAVRHETLRRLETEGTGRRQGPRALSIAVSLGELYWLGLTGLFEGLGSVALRGTRGNDDGR